MAGTSSSKTPFGSLSIEKADAPSDSEFAKMMADIVKRTKERNEELANYKDADTIYKKWLQDLQDTFQPTFYYRNLLGEEPKPKVKGQKQAYDYTDKKDVFVDFAYLAFTRMADPVKEKNTHVFQSTNGVIVAKKGKLEFFETIEPAKDGKKATTKEFSLDDAYNIILLAMQDRSMMPPNKMKLHGTAKERAMLHHAATQINTLIADPNQRIELNPKNPPKLVLGRINPVGLKSALQNDPFDQMVMDIRNNDIDPNGWKIREEQEAQRKAAEAEKAQKKTAEAKPSSDGPQGGPASPDPSTPPTPPNGGGDGGSTPSEEAAWDHDPAETPPSVTTAEQTPAPNSEPEHNPAHVAAAESAPENTAQPDPVEAEAATTDAEQKPADIMAETMSPDTADKTAEEVRMENLRRQAEEVYDSVRHYIFTKHEDAMMGKDPVSEVYELLEFRQKGMGTPENVKAVVDRMTREGLVVMNSHTGEAAIRGFAQFTPHNPDYTALALSVVRHPDRFVGKTVEDLMTAYQHNILADKILSTQGVGPHLSETARRHLAYGMAHEYMGYLIKDNIVQMRDGKISYVAKSFDGSLNLKKNFATAVAQPQQAAQAKPAMQQETSAEKETARPPAQSNQDLFARLDGLLGKLNQPAKSSETAQPTHPAAQPVQESPQEKGPQVTIVTSDYSQPRMHSVKVDIAAAAEVAAPETTKPEPKQEMQGPPMPTTMSKPVAEAPDVLEDKNMDDLVFDSIADLVNREILPEGSTIVNPPKPTPEELGFKLKPITGTEPPTAEDFRAAAFHPPEIVSKPYVEGELEQQLIEIMRQSEQQNGVVIDESTLKKPKIDPSWHVPLRLEAAQ